MAESCTGARSAASVMDSVPRQVASGMDIVIRYGHIVGFMALFACLVAEHLMTTRQVTGATLRRLARIDLVYGASILIVLITGLLMVAGEGRGKGAHYYLANGVFHAKVGLFVVVLGLSIPATLFYRRHHQAADATLLPVPRSIIMAQRVQLLIILILPLLGLLLTWGYGARDGVVMP
jgi:putative membrane protein